MCDPVFFRHMAPPMRVPELYRVEKIRPALVQHYIIESALLFYLYHRSARSIPLDTCLDYYPSLQAEKQEEKREKELKNFREQNYIPYLGGGEGFRYAILTNIHLSKSRRNQR